MHYHQIIFRADGGTTFRIAGARTRRGGSDSFQTEAGALSGNTGISRRFLSRAGGKAELVDEVDAHHAGFQRRGPE